MQKSQAIEFFGNQTKLAKAAGVSKAAVSLWGEIIPERRAARLADITNGALQYDRTLYSDEQGAA